MCVACFDITGTLIHHKTGRLVPLMPQLLRRLHEAGWRVTITTRHGKGEAEKVLPKVYRAAEISDSSITVAAGVADKAAYVRRLVADGVTDLVFVDDNPKHIVAVQKAAQNLGDRLRTSVVHVFGFLGSRNYAPEAYSRSISAGARYALTAIDLAEQLESWSSFKSLLPTLTLDEIIELIPGLQHPMSATGGESQSIPASIFEHANELTADRFDRIWGNVGLVQCDRCMLYLMVRLAMTECRHPESMAVLEGTHDVHEYLRTQGGTARLAARVGTMPRQGPGPDCGGGEERRSGQQRRRHGADSPEQAALSGNPRRFLSIALSACDHLDRLAAIVLSASCFPPFCWIVTLRQAANGRMRQQRSDASPRRYRTPLGERPFLDRTPESI